MNESFCEETQRERADKKVMWVVYCANINTELRVKKEKNESSVWIEVFRVDWGFKKSILVVFNL
jgi:hypothetical protein